ncbi:proline dehydrogenase [Neisseria gonorrhoeae]|uniref:Proline dehydrogenase n=1 Tax=Neisseria gonorrhoeae TaxID=485 RepID=A0A378VSP4_NEIGO|nr:proline dehydrogenase [Neisseria gonorrhoeae]
MEALVSDPDLAGYKGIGFVVQAYQNAARSSSTI